MRGLFARTRPASLWDTIKQVSRTMPGVRLAAKPPPPASISTPSSSAPGMSGMYQLYRLRELGLAGAGVRGRHRRRRHLVLEPLSRRALRFRELFLRLLLLAGAAGGMGLVRAFRRPAGNAALSATTSPTSSTCAATSSSAAASTAAHLRRGHAKLGRSRWRTAAAHSRALPDHRDRPALGADHAAHRGRRQLSRASPSTPRAGRRSRSTSPASASR